MAWPARKPRLRGVMLAAVTVAATTSAHPSFGQALPAARTTQSVPAWQSAAGGKMQFDVASIKLSKPGAQMHANFALSEDDSFPPKLDLLTANFPLSVYIEFAYKLFLGGNQQEAMLAHLPEWVKTDRYEIQARAAGNPTKDQMRLMMQSLLADRFKLAVHFETRQTPALVLTLAKRGKLGPDLRPHAAGPPCTAPPPTAPASGWPASGPAMFPFHCYGFALMRTPDGMLLLGSRNTTMALLGDSLTTIPGVISRPVVDRTGLNGRYDFTIRWALQSNRPPASPAAAPQPDVQGPTLLEALREQLGLKLSSATAPLQVLVIDHVERPSPN